MSENRCTCCGAAIPEGRQICPRCENLDDLAWKVPYSGGDIDVPSNCKHYDSEEGWCKAHTKWESPMPEVEGCTGVCGDYAPDNNVGSKWEQMLREIAHRAPGSYRSVPTPSAGEWMLGEIGYIRDMRMQNRFIHLEEPMSITLEDDGVWFEDEGWKFKVGFRELLAAAQLIKEMENGNP